MTRRTHFLVAALVAGSLFSGVARAGQAPAQAPAPGLAAKWEDLLLLEAIRYLRLSPAQLEAMLPLARSAEDRLARLTQEAAAALATLEGIARQNREALVGGAAGDPESQASALRQREAMQERRSRAEAEIVDELAPRLAKILTREQVLRACLLALGKEPPDPVKSPALLDPPA